MGERFTKHYPGSATLEETCRACIDEIIDGQPKRLKRMEGIIHDLDDGTSENVNEATYETEDSPLAILEVPNDLLFVDVSTPQGASNAAAASNGRTNVGGPGAEFNIWVQNRMVTVQILGKHNS